MANSQLWKTFQIWSCCHGNQIYPSNAILQIQIELSLTFQEMLWYIGISNTRKVIFCAILNHNFSKICHCAVRTLFTDHTSFWANMYLKICSSDHFADAHTTHWALVQHISSSYSMSVLKQSYHNEINNTDLWERQLNNCSWFTLLRWIITSHQQGCFPWRNLSVGHFLTDLRKWPFSYWWN